MTAGGILLGIQVDTALENERKAEKWHGDSVSEPVRIPSPLEWVPSIEQKETFRWDSRPKLHTRIGTLRIPAIRAKIPIWEGTSEKELSRGVGRHSSEGLALPGEPGNVALAGHRESALQGAGKIKKGDAIILDTKPGRFTYRVTKTWITKAEDRTVVIPTEKAVVRLYTCHPFSAGSSTDHRYIIEAELIQ